MVINNKPHIFNYNKIDDCKLPEGRISIPFGVALLGGVSTEVPIPYFSGAVLVGDFYLLDLGSLQNGVKGISGIKSLELDLQFFAGGTLGQEPLQLLNIVVQDSQQFYSLIPDGVITSLPAEDGQGFMHLILPIISNAPTKIWFVYNGVAGDTSELFINGNANNFEMAPYTVNSLS